MTCFGNPAKCIQRYSTKKKVILCLLAISLLLFFGYKKTFLYESSSVKLGFEAEDSEQIHQDAGKPFEKNGEDCKTIDIAIVCAGYNASREVVTLIKSMLFYGRQPLHFHFIVDSVAKLILGNLFRTWDISDFTVSFYTSDELTEKVSWIPNFHYSGIYGLFKLVLLDILPEEIHHVIVLDVDIILLSDIADLWQLIDNFKGDQAIGLVENQSDWYLGKLRTDHPPWPALGRGYNSGVMLLHCEKLRKMNWNNIWESVTREQLKTLPGTSLADQDIVNAVLTNYQYLVYTLPCLWNVQLSMNTRSEECYGRNVLSIKALHWNSPQKQKPKLRNRHGVIFKNIFYSFVEYDGALLKSPLSNCVSETDLQYDAYQEDDLCQELIFKSLQLHRTHLYYLEFSYVTTDINDVTLTTHLSMDRLPMLEQICKNWPGPISVAIFLRDSDTRELRDYISTSPVFNHRSNIGFHLVFRNFDDASYPINLLRNIAWQQSVTSFVFLCDVDFMPSVKLYDYLKDSVLPTHGESSKVAYIVPAFESLWYKIDFPETKSDLFGQWDKGTVTPFRSYMWSQGHGATNFSKWRSSDQMYSVDRTKDFEPYVVLPKKLCPPYDKRFFGFGWNKVSHIMELDAAGFEFMVIPFGFIIHMPHMASVDIMKYRSSDAYRQCLHDIKTDFIKTIAFKYHVDAGKLM